MKNKYILVAICAIFLISCQQENLDNSERDINLAEGSVDKQLETKYRLLDITPNAYHDYFKMTDNTIGFNSLKKNSFSDHSLVENMNFTSTSKKSVFLNEKSFNSQNKKSLNLKPEDIFGRILTVQLGNENGKNKSEEIKLYVPKKLNISKPAPISDEKITILAYYKNFLVEWNADPKNEEGLMVAIEYLGENVDASKNSDEYIQNVDHIELDNGKYVLKQAMFEGIPNLSYVNLILLRGNVEISEFNNETLKVYAESHQRVPLIIVKDLNTIGRLE